MVEFSFLVNIKCLEVLPSVMTSVYEVSNTQALGTSSQPDGNLPDLVGQLQPRPFSFKQENMFPTPNGIEAGVEEQGGPRLVKVCGWRVSSSPRPSPNTRGCFWSWRISPEFLLFTLPSGL